MKTTTKLLSVTIVILAIFFTTLTSCKKETVTNTIVQTDTAYLNTYTPITMAVITANKWMIEEGRGVRGGSLFYYLRGGNPLNNSENCDDEWIEFHNDNTGTYHEQSGITRTITWEFNNADNDMLTIHFTNTPADFDVIWNNMRDLNTSLYFDEYYTDGNLGFNSHCQMIRIPRP